MASSLLDHQGMQTDELLDLSHVRRLARSGEARRIREAAELTIPEVAGAVGTTATSIARWERGERAPRGAPALRYGELLHRLTREIAVQ